MNRVVMFSWLLLALTTAAAAQAPLVVGVCPFEDETGTQMGEHIGRLLPVMFLNKVKAGSFAIVIVNPGPTADPTDLEWPAEVARMMGADVVLLGRVRALAESAAKTPSAGKLTGRAVLGVGSARLALEATLVEAASARNIKTLATLESVRGAWFSDVATLFSGISFDPPKFAGTPMGRAVGRGVEKLLEEIDGAVRGIAPTGKRRVATGVEKCAVSIKVWYQDKNRASKTYSIAVNRKEESLGLRDGVLTLELPSGPALVHITVHDAPFKQLVQPTYYANPLVDCSQPARSLTLEIGRSGEGILRWK